MYGRKTGKVGEEGAVMHWARVLGVGGMTGGADVGMVKLGAGVQPVRERLKGGHHVLMAADKFCRRWGMRMGMEAGVAHRRFLHLVAVEEGAVVRWGPRGVVRIGPHARLVTGSGMIGSHGVRRIGSIRDEGLGRGGNAGIGREAGALSREYPVGRRGFHHGCDWGLFTETKMVGGLFLIKNWRLVNI